MANYGSGLNDFLRHQQSAADYEYQRMLAEAQALQRLPSAMLQSMSSAACVPNRAEPEPNPVLLLLA